MIDFLDGYLKRGMKVFEFGCGFSTIYYAKKGCVVYGVETRREWVERVENLAGENGLNVNVVNVLPKDFADGILKIDEVFDVIVVDSIKRLECMSVARRVYKHGLIVLDNSERRNLQGVNEIMEGFECMVFEGVGVAREGESQSKIFFKNV